VEIDNRFSRQILAFGADGQREIERQRIGIVGLGGIGSQVTQALAYLGGRRFVLVDDELVEDTNLNRLIGATPEDVIAKRRKTEVAERMIRGINDGAEVIPIDLNLRSKPALDHLTTCSVIFGCVDNDGARLILMELAASYSVPLIDSASEILLDESHTRLEDFGGRVVVCRPGDFCLTCAGEIDVEAAKAELESDDVRLLRRAHGYGLGDHLPTPAVVSLNGIVSNFAVTEFLAMITHFREPFRKRVYQGIRGIILQNKDERKNDCYNCGYLVGKREGANIYRYVPKGDGKAANKSRR
jgi:molybdopterin-synthase adenylyltransferase